MNIPLIVLWIIVIIQFVESSTNARDCASLDIVWSENNENQAQNKFIQEASWGSLVYNIVAFEWISTANGEKSLRNICTCVLFRTLTEDQFTWVDVEEFYSNMKNELQMKKKVVKVVMKRSVKPFSAIECSFRGLKRTFVRGYRKKNLFAPVYNIYLEYDKTENGKTVNDEFITFDAYLESANPSKL